MSNFKKSVLTSVLLAGMAVTAGVNAASVTATWTGEVPESSADDQIVITGLGGSTADLRGTITSDEQGVFITDAIVLESHVNDGDATTPIVGALTAANWTVGEHTVKFDGMANPAQIVEVEVNGQTVTEGELIPSVETVSALVKQTASLPVAEVGGSSVQANLTLLASMI